MKSWQAIIIFIGMVVSFWGGYHFRDTTQKISQSDTITIVDTIRDSIPYPVVETRVEIVTERVPEYITLNGDTVNDTVYINLPITQKEYKTDVYHAYISGYRPNLDSIEVYQQTRYVMNTVSPRRFGIGIIGGYGIGKNGLSPYIGIGAFYRIW